MSTDRDAAKAGGVKFFLRRHHHRLSKHSRSCLCIFLGGLFFLGQIYNAYPSPLGAGASSAPKAKTM